VKKIVLPSRFFKKEENSVKRIGWGFFGGVMVVTLVGVGIHIFKRIIL